MASPQHSRARAPSCRRRETRHLWHLLCVSDSHKLMDAPWQPVPVGSWGWQSVQGGVRPQEQGVDSPGQTPPSVASLFLLPEKPECWAIKENLPVCSPGWKNRVWAIMLLGLWSLRTTGAHAVGWESGSVQAPAPMSRHALGDKQRPCSNHRQTWGLWGRPPDRGGPLPGAACGVLGGHPVGTPRASPHCRPLSLCSCPLPLEPSPA